jgi:glycosyltransferase involved in cell wall biosynthesis
MTTNLSLTIICISKNSQYTIERMIKSLHSQKYKNFDIVFVDGCSSDDTVNIIRKYLRERDRLVLGPDQGIYDALNKGIRVAKDGIIGLLHSNDYYSDEYVLSNIFEIFNNNKIDGCYADLYYIDNIYTIKRKWIAGNFKLSSVVYGWMIPHPTLFLRKSTYESLNFYNTSFKISGDYELMLRLFKIKNLNLFYLNKYIIAMSIGGASNNNFKNLINKIKEDYKALVINGYNPLIALIFKRVRKLNQFYVSTWFCTFKK